MSFTAKTTDGEGSFSGIDIGNLEGNTVLYSDTFGAITSILPRGTSGQVLRAGAAGAVSWGPLGGGTVTSVGLTAPGTLFSVSGSPITTSGTITINTLTAVQGTGAIVLETSPTITNLVLSNLTANTLVFADLTKKLISVAQGTAGQVLVSSGGGTVSWSNAGTVSSVGISVPSFLSVSGSPVVGSGTITIGTAVTPSGTGAIVLATSPTITELTLGSVTAQRLLFADENKEVVSIAVGVLGQVLTAGPSNTVVWQAPTATGVTSVGLSTSSPILNIVGSPITTSGTITINPTLNPVGSGAIVLATNPTITGLTLNDLQSNAVVYADATKKLTSVTPGTVGQVLTLGAGNAVSWQNLSTAGVTSFTLAVPSFLTVSGSPLTTAGTITIGTTVTPVGTGAIVLANTPTITTPVLTTPRLNDSNLYLRTSGTTTGIVYGATRDGPDISGLGGGRLRTNGSTILEWNATRVRLPQNNASQAMFLDSNKDIQTRPGFSYLYCETSASIGLPNNTWTFINNANVISSGGNNPLLLWNGTECRFRNESGSVVLFTATISGKPIGNNIKFAMRIGISGQIVNAAEMNNGANEISLSATGRLGGFESVEFEANQYSGFGQNMNTVRICITTYPIL